MAQNVHTSRSRFLIAAGAAFAAALFMAPAASAERLSDKDVAQLIDRIDHERDRFEDQLDGKLKGSVLRGPGGEVNVNKYLDDLQDNVHKLKERFKPGYAASAEANTVLRQASDIQRFMSAQPANLDGASEWTRLATSLGELASAYGITMPVSEGQSARRMSDTEVSKAASALAKSADGFKKALDASFKADKTIDKVTRDAAIGDVDGLKKDAEKLASVVGDGRPASGEAQAVLGDAAKIRAAASARTLSPAAKTAWSGVEGQLDKVAQGFGLPPR